MKGTKVEVSRSKVKIAAKKATKNRTDTAVKRSNAKPSKASHPQRKHTITSTMNATQQQTPRKNKTPVGGVKKSPDKKTQKSESGGTAGKKQKEVKKAVTFAVSSSSSSSSASLPRSAKKATLNGGGRPPLTKGITPQEVKTYYYFDEIQAFLRKNMIKSTGSALDLAKRTVHFLEHGQSKL